MSEDPVKYEPMDEQPETKAEEGMRFVKALSQDDANRSAKQQIRIEALRAATTIVAAQVAAGGGFVWEGKNVPPNEYLLKICPLIAAYLEGE